MVAQNRRVKRDLRKETTHQILVAFEHDLTIQEGVALRPEQITSILLHLLGVGQENGEVTIRKGLVVRQGARLGDVDLGQFLADVAAPGM